MTTSLDIKEISRQYSSNAKLYEKLGANISQALELLLREKGIPFLSINYRVKDEFSFIEKIKRKEYSTPFEQIEDICGIRIICYYQSDIIKISEIINLEFDVSENEDKEKKLEPDQFGYRSTHLIAKIKDNWLKVPNYRGLENFKAEIQVRTVLMHAWAEIEHKLSYKNDTHIPSQFKRQLYRMSAKLEEVDEQFEEIKNSVNSYKTSIIEKANAEKIDYRELELNLDSLQVVLDLIFPENLKSPKETADLLDELIKYKISLKTFLDYYDKVKEFLPQIEEEVFERPVTPDQGWAQVGGARMILDLNNESYFNDRSLPTFHRELKIKWSKKLNLR